MANSKLHKLQSRIITNCHKTVKISKNYTVAAKKIMEEKMNWKKQKRCQTCIED